MSILDPAAYFHDHGYFVWPNFLSSADCDALKSHADSLAVRLTQAVHPHAVFSAGVQSPDFDRYLIGSARNIRPFFEAHHDLERGPVCNKIGHALHVQDPVFKALANHTVWRRVATDLKLENPQVCQSMIVFKSAHVGGSVQWHQDGTFLYAEPMPIIGFWLALEDADLGNGCLWVTPGAHHYGLHQRYVRGQHDRLEFRAINPHAGAATVPEMPARAVPVSKGTLVALHGHLPHRSEANRSSRGRCAVTFHALHASSQLDALNWIHPPRLCSLGPSRTLDMS
ncbi:MAG: phytanoyl-CoA dioxygenase family protein [Myxococcota bacterium]|nr:phytanoyl-CoA dioxygenase family protein [Myxococcota bacterium]